MINIKNKEVIYIPIRKITGFNIDYLLEAFIREIREKNSNIFINVNQYRKFNNKSTICKIILCTCVILFLLAGIVITSIK